MNAFTAPKKFLGNLDAEVAATLIAAAADVALILDLDGAIRDVAVNSAELAAELESRGKWVGRLWVDTVTPETRAKIDSLLREAASNAAPRWRQVNHPSTRPVDIPILYSAVQVGAGRIVAFGRDLRAVSELQQRLVDAQQSMERDYSRLRHVETRYRLLFEMSSEAVVILDAVTQKAIEANPAARALFGDTGAQVIGQVFPGAFEADTAPAVHALLVSVRANGRAEEVRVRLAATGREVIVSAWQFRQESSAFVLVRVLPVAADAATAPVMPMLQAKLIKVVENAPDGFVVTDQDGVILTANAAFVEMAQLASEEQARGESLDRWLGRAGVDVGVLIANLRQRGSVRLFATSMRGEFGDTAEVEISAVSVTNGGQPCLGFAIRNVGRRLSSVARSGRDLPRSVEQLTELIGRVSLKDLVREATDVIEKLCIETALDMTGDNRASAAEMLGLSRQSLYVKLRRYGLGDLAEETRN